MNVQTNLIAIVAAELDAYRDDAECFWDTLDGETDALTVIDRTLTSMQDDEALAEAIKAQEAALKARRDRIAMRADAKKRVLGQVLRAAGEKSVERPRATVSVRDGNLSVRIEDEAEIPSQLLTVKTTTAPDKTAIKKQIEAGERVPGASLVRGGDIVTVRVAK